MPEPAPTVRRTVDLIRELAALRPVTADVPAVNRAAERLGAYLASHGLHVQTEDWNGRQILYAATVPGRVTPVLLNAHLDVVPADDEAAYTLREENGWLLGRGAHDCLGNAAMAAALLVRLAGRARVGALFTTDEEAGGATTRVMLERGVRATDLVLVLDGPGYAVGVAQKGILTVRLIAHGCACHAAEPWKGDNAIDRLVDGYQRLRRLFPPCPPGDRWHDTLAATLLTAGTVRNRVPERAELVVNIRFTRVDDHQRLVELLAAESGLEVVPQVECQPLAFDPQTPALQELAGHMERHLGHPIAIERMNGATDARHFAALGVPVAILGVPGRDAHAAAEALDLDALRRYEEMLGDFLAVRAAG